ncbi:MAG: RidA family protein [Candidatus Izemoplasmatales bacterium]|nr:RidA family protein [bacterium]MDZ4196000.1 RidA family protein [Candidatus Izemoplasmatales bacterium]
MKSMIQTDHAPKAIGPYSQGVKIHNQLYVSGQIPFVPETMTLISEDIGLQTKQSLENILAIVKEAGFLLTDIVKCTVYLKDMNEFSAMNSVYQSFFGDHKPARAAVEVARLPRDVRVEIDAICVKE